MTTNSKALLDAVLRELFLPFVRKGFATASGGDQLQSNWHQHAIAWELEQIRIGADTRLIVNMPPRNLKSIICSVAWPAFMLGHDPTLRFVCVSYSYDLARKHANDCRALMQTDWYQRLFPNTRLQRGNMGEMDFKTTAGGGRLSTSVLGTLTGRGGDIIIIDDPIKPEDAMSETVRKQCLNWFSNTLSSRLNDKETGAIILVMQRLHEEDLAGHLLETDGWRHLCLPAIAEDDMRIQLGPNRFHTFKSGEALHPERESKALLNKLRQEVGSATFAAQYQQDPVPAEGLHVKRNWLRYYSEIPEKRPGDRIVQSWDTATKDGVFNDYSVCVTALVRGREVHVLDVMRDKLEFPKLKKRVIAHANKFESDVLLIEDAASGAALIQALRDEKPKGVPRPIRITPEGDKVTRFAAQTARIESGEVLFFKDAHWLGEFERELLGFPNLKHDDQVDALTQLLAWWSPRARLYEPGEMPDSFGPFVVEGDSHIGQFDY